MFATVCQLDTDPMQFQKDWTQLIDHTRSHRSQLVVLPEMIFSPWLAAQPGANEKDWTESVRIHDVWIERLPELGAETVIGSRPVILANTPHNEGFCWTREQGYRAVHLKYYLPEEEAYWEASWYRRGTGAFEPFEAASLNAGMMLCTDMWFTEHARALGKSGIDILAVPRCTAAGSTEKWLAGGVSAAIMSGAYCLSSNRSGVDPFGNRFGGSGWIIDPESGDFLALTDSDQPFKTVELDLARARNAKHTYPRYVSE
jgi:N-carbamoylputrescine amidase